VVKEEEKGIIPNMSLKTGVVREDNYAMAAGNVDYPSDFVDA